MSRVGRVLLLLLPVVLASQGYSGQKAGPWQDVPANHWAAVAIKTVSVDHDWMGPRPERLFRPGDPTTRRDLAVAAVRALAPGVKPFPKVTFTDLPESDPAFPYANVAAGLGWMGTTKANEFLPAKPPTKTDVSVVLAKALGLKAELAGLDAIASAGVTLRHPRSFSALALAGSLRLFFNHTDDGKDLTPATIVPRADAAYALARAAAAAGTWRIAALKGFRTIALPAMSTERRAAVEFAFSYVGYPYLPAGEWHTPTPKGYCCGAQLQGGFDCSGFVWWVVRAPSKGYDNTRVRSYKGWPLPERSSREMARAAPRRLGVTELLPGDLVFSDIDGKGEDWKAVDHVGISLGAGWMIHASTPGVLIEWIGDGWWAPHVRWGRSIDGSPPAPAPSGSATPKPSASPVATGSAKPTAKPAPTTSSNPSPKS